MGRVILLLLGLLHSAAAVAEAHWVESVGHAVIAGDIHRARQLATDDAMRKALLSRGAQVRSESTVDQQMKVSDSISVRARGRLTHMEVISETQQGDQLSVAIKAQVKAAGHCGDKSHRPVKSVAFTSFTRQFPAQSNIGRLEQIDTLLPLELARRGYQQSWYLAQLDPNQLTQMPAKTWGAGGASTTQVRRIAQNSAAQYVISAEVSDLAMLTAHNYRHPAYLKRIKWWGKEPRDVRKFALHVRVYEALTGSVIYDQQYQTQGRWDFAANRVVGFASGEFWRSDYGVQVDVLLDKIVDDIGRKLQCQPLLVPLQQVAEQSEVYLELGANQGLKVGDVLAVFRHEPVTLSGADYQQTVAQAKMAMVPTEMTLTVEQVHPLFSRARANQHLSQARQYVAVIW